MKANTRGSARGGAVFLGLVVVCVAVLVLWGLRSENLETASEPSSPNAELEAPAEVEVAKVTDSKVAPAAAVGTARKTAKPEASTKLTAPCTGLLNELKEVDLQRFSRATSLPFEFPATTECVSSGLDEHLAEAARRYRVACAPLQTRTEDPLSDVETRKRNQACMLTLLTLRAQLGAADGAAIPSKELSEPKQLEDRLVDAMAKKDLNATLDVAKRLLELDASHRGANRALMNSYIQLASSYNGTGRDAFWKDVQEAVKGAMRHGGLDQEEVIRARLYTDFQQNKSADRLMRLSDATATQFPHAGSPYLFKAIAAFEMNAKADAIRYLQEYGQRSNDPQAIATIERIQAGNNQPFQVAFVNQVDLLSVPAD